MKKDAKGEEKDYSAELILHNAMMFAIFDMAEAEMIAVENEAAKRGFPCSMR